MMIFMLSLLALFGALFGWWLGEAVFELYASIEKDYNKIVRSLTLSATSLAITLMLVMAILHI